MPKISESDFRKVLSGRDFGTLYYICGTEKMLVTHNTKKLINKVAGSDPSDFNYHTFTNDFDVDEFAVALQVVPFVSEFNVVVVKDLDFADFSSADGDKIFDLISNVSGDTIVILTFPTKLDEKMNAKDKKLKTLAAKKGTVVELNKLTVPILQKKLVSWASKRNVVLSPQVAGTIVDYCGTDLTALKNELEKLCAYVGDGGEITKEHVDKLVTKNLESSIFDLSKAVINHDGTTAFKVIDRLIYQKEEPIAILAVLATTFVDMYRARIAIKCGSRSTDLSKWFTYKSEYRLRQAENNSKRTSTAVLRKSIDAITETDILLKSTRMNDRVQLELLIVKLLMIANEDR